jgi:hypothetical protein
MRVGVVGDVDYTVRYVCSYFVMNICVPLLWSHAGNSLAYRRIDHDFEDLIREEIY